MFTVLDGLLVPSKSVVAPTSSDQRLLVVVVHLNCSVVKEFFRYLNILIGEYFWLKNISSL